MGASRNQESTRQEKDGVVYYDRGILTCKDGRRYQRYAIKTHFVQPGEDQAELVRRYVLPLYQPGDCLSFTAKVMGMCTNNVRTLADTFHMAVSAEPASALTLYGSQLAHVHTANPAGRLCPEPDDGEDYEALLRALKDGGYDARVSIEGVVKPFEEKALLGLQALDRARRAVWD